MNAAVAMAAGFPPNAREQRVAIGAEAVGGYAIARDHETVALDHGGSAVMTAGVFALAYAAGQVAGIDVAQAGGLAVLDDPHEVFGGGVGRAALTAARLLRW